jgi:hypothetical protein
MQHKETRRYIHINSRRFGHYVQQGMYKDLLIQEHLSAATLAAVSMVIFCFWAKLLMMVMIDVRLSKNFCSF